MLRTIRTFINYLAGKRSEVAELGVNDVYMAKVILDIHRKRTHKTRELVPLFALQPIHPLDREETRKATATRAATLRANKGAILATRRMMFDDLNEYLPSISWIKVVQETPNSYLAYEGNGRLGALQEVFAPEDGVEIEVELYHFRNPRKIVRRLNRLRRMNGILPL